MEFWSVYGVSFSFQSDLENGVFEMECFFVAAILNTRFLTSDFAKMFKKNWDGENQKLNGGIMQNFARNPKMYPPKSGNGR